MPEDLLNDTIEDDRETESLRRFNKLRNLLLLLVALVVFLNIYISFRYFPLSAVITSPSFLAPMRVPYAFSLLFVVLLPVACLVCAGPLALVPFRLLSYSQKLSLIFLFILWVMESICLYELVVDSLRHKTLAIFLSLSHFTFDSAV